MGKIIFIILGLLLVVIGTGFLLRLNRIYPEEIWSYLQQPKLMTVTKYSSGDSGMSCSKPITVKKGFEPVGRGSYWQVVYSPINENEAKAYCRVEWTQ